jgi:hypothetical protein
MVPHRYALAQLAEAMIVEAIPQLRLAHQKNLQKLPIVGFQIREQSHLFEQLVRQVLRFVDDEHGNLVLFHLAEEKFIQHRHRFQSVQPKHLKPKLHHDRFVQKFSVQHRIQDQGGRIFVPQFIQQSAAECGLSRAYLPGQLNKPFPLANAVQQMIERFAVLGAIKQKTRVRRYVKRRLFQAIVFKVHRSIPTIGNFCREVESLPLRSHAK